MTLAQIMQPEEFRAQHIHVYLSHKMPNFSCPCCGSKHLPSPNIYEDKGLSFSMRDILKTISSDELERESQVLIIPLVCLNCGIYFDLNASLVGLYFLHKEK